MFLDQVRATPGTGTEALESHSTCLNSHSAWQDLRTWINEHLFMGVWQGYSAKEHVGWEVLLGKSLKNTTYHSTFQTQQLMPCASFSLSMFCAFMVLKSLPSNLLQLC